MSHLIKGSKGRGTDQGGRVLGKWVGHPTFTSSTQGIRIMNQGVKNRENK